MDIVIHYRQDKLQTSPFYILDYTYAKPVQRSKSINIDVSQLPKIVSNRSFVEYRAEFLVIILESMIFYQNNLLKISYVI